MAHMNTLKVILDAHVGLGLQVFGAAFRFLMLKVFCFDSKPNP